MPSTLISVRRDWSPEQRRAIIEAVQSAKIEAFKIPEQDRLLRLQVFAPDDFAVRRSATGDFTLVEIDMFAGRTLAAKKALYQAIVRNLGRLGIAPSDVTIVLREIPRDNWGIRGGRAASEVDLGFKVEV